MSHDHHSDMRLLHIGLLSAYIWIYASSMCLLPMRVNKPCNWTLPYIHDCIFQVVPPPACVLPCHTWFSSSSFGRHISLLAYLIRGLPSMCAPQYPHLCSFFLLYLLLLYLLYPLFYLPLSFHASFIHVGFCIHSLAWLVYLFLFLSWMSFYVPIVPGFLSSHAMPILDPWVMR